MADAGAGTQGPLRVFISYSRKDEEFAQDLLAGLEAAGFEPYLDKHHIAAGEDWEARLGRLIEAADAIVFIMSPDSIASQRCGWELERSDVLQKRLLPIVLRRVPKEQVPQRLRQLNYIYFDRPGAFGAGLRSLAGALRTNLEWIREHTRIGEAALRWDSRGRADALLLRGVELTAASDWLKEQPPYGSEPSLLMREFINASGDAEAARSTTERQRLAEMQAAQDQREKALERERAAQDARETALKQAQAALRKAQRALAAVAVLMACVVVGIVGWINQAAISEQINWFTTVRPYMRAQITPYVLSAEAERALKARDSFKECARDCPEMVVIAAGDFAMGSPTTEEGRYENEEPQHKVMIAKRFAVSKLDVTFADWDACVSVGGCPQATDSGYGRGPKPVINVTWNDAQRYVAWFSRMTGKPYRLLTEAEWEYAARAGTTTAYYWGEAIGSGKANCNGCGSQWDNREPSPAGSFEPNGFGLYDIAGNVWQWVQDCYHDDYHGAPVDGSVWTNGDCGRHVIRGGSWIDPPRDLRSAFRLAVETDNRSTYLGFRLGRSLAP
jgi:formylglycine-generating enzyme required for sulfatase activity